MSNLPPEDNDDGNAKAADAPGTNRAINGNGAESVEAAAALRDAEDTSAACWWLGSAADALRELAGDFDTARELTRLFQFRGTAALRKQLARKRALIFKLIEVATCDVD